MLRIGHLAQSTIITQIHNRFHLRSALVKLTLPSPVVVVVRFQCDKSFVKKFDWGSSKSHRKVVLKDLVAMADPKIEEILAPFRASVKEQVC